MNVNFHGMQVKAQNYSGAQIIENPMAGGWMLFPKDGSAPYAGTLREMKKIVDEDGSAEFIGENTYN